MMNTMIKHLLWTVLLTSTALLTGCGSEAAESADAAKPTVVATTTMITDLAEQIGGEHINVVGIMKVGEDPHVYDVRPRDAQSIGKADLVLMNGLHLEATLVHVIENNAAGPVVALAESKEITPLGSQQYEGAPDPHCWFNVKYFKVYAEQTRDALMQLDPDHAEDYRAKADAYITQLDVLDAWVQTQLDSIPRQQRVMVTSHDAFQYLGDRYGIDVLAVIGMSTEQQPKPQDLENLKRQITERGVRALFIETSVSQTLNDIIRKVADATGVNVGGTLYSDSLGPPESGAGTYVGMVKHNINTLTEALK